MGKKTFWICLAVFMASYLMLRLFWLTGDPGIASVWEYGYNATDEGYYLDGGKEKLLWNHFVDLTRTEAFTYGFSAGTHWLSYLAHLAFGLSTWTWRLPFFLIAGLAWIVAFVHLSGKSSPANALFLCLSASSLPMQIAYERTASNDVLIGSLAVIAYVTATGKDKWRLFAASLLTGLVVLVKPSVWALIPVVAAGILQAPKFRRKWVDVTCYVAAAVACVFLCKLLAAVAVLPDAHQANVSMWEIVRRTTTHYPLPRLTDFASHFRGLSAFPRDPSYALLGVSTVFVFVLPICMAMKNLVNLRFNGNTLLFVSIPGYVAAINVMNTQYTHYFIPALMFLPIVVHVAADEIEATCADGTIRLKSVLTIVGLVIAACAIGLLFLSGFTLTPQQAQLYYSRIYNFPSKNVWGATSSVMAVFMFSVLALLLILRGPGHARRNALAWLVSVFFAASVIFAVLPAVQLAPYIRQPSTQYFAPMSVVLLASTVLLVCVFGLKGGLLRNRFMTPFFAVSIAICYAATPNWRKAARELVRPATHYHAAAASQLAALLPADAIVIGERANQMLMSLPIRTATTFAANSNPIPVIKSILASAPNAKLYALADSQHSYNLQHYREHSREYALRPVKSFKMPSFGTGALADVYLCKIEVLNPSRR